MTRDWQRLERILDEVLDETPRATLAEREAAVRARCGDDLALYDAVMRWVRGCEGDAESVLDTPPHPSTVQAALAAALETSRHATSDTGDTDVERVHHEALTALDGAFDSALEPVDERARCEGTIVGPWRLVREIGRGGMGVVYLAERIDGDVAMRVALKFMRQVDVMDALGLRRFRDERRILATLAHPSIARLIDVGVDHDTPWLATEYVDGVPIDEWCVSRALDVDARITLFCEVVDAVQHAHARLVVHRDLKPANILVSESGRPVLLDFGIAKLLDAGSEQGHDRPGFADDRTRPGAQPMTPAYASPEQRDGEAPSTASDVYALGVVLHELLTGHLPETGELASSVVRRRGTATTDTARLARRLRGDLDTIIARAIDEMPARRYATADALAADLRRHLRGLPVLARRDSTSYRLRKFVARHPVAVSTSAFAVCLVAAFTLFTAAQSRLLRLQALALQEQAATLRLERDKAMEVTQFLKDVLSSADPYKSGGTVPTLREVLDRGTVDMEHRLSARPEIRAQLYSAIAPAYFGLGDWSRAGDLAAEAVALRRGAPSPDSTDLAGALVYLASVRLNQGRAGEAEARAREALSIMRTLRSGTGNDSLSALAALGAALQKQQRYHDAGDVLASLLDVERSRRPADPMRLAQFARNLAHVRRDEGRYAEAVQLYREAYAHHVDVLGTDHPESANSAVNLGYAYALEGNLDAALPLLRAGVETKRRLLGLAHPDVAADQMTYAKVLAQAGRTAEANRLRAEALTGSSLQK